MHVQHERTQRAGAEAFTPSWQEGLEWSITFSYSEMAEAGPLELYQKEIDFVTYEIDPKSGVITKVDLPPNKIRISYHRQPLL